ncbi:hypothetical protein BDN67DRAFT_705628 [Paxillus ammoniavirescens]|nr:hypothetical protein BDN67DRAFT_705628 [Paxillus ammoniavirescens]
MAAWASHREGGIRNYIYALDTIINPSTYQTLDKPGYWGVHAIGEVWAEMLWVVQQRLIGTCGFSETILPPTPNADGSLQHNDFYRPQTFNPLSGPANHLVPKHGNTLLMQLVLDGKKLQPCSPGFFDARDAIIQDDEILTQHTETWRPSRFAKSQKFSPKKTPRRWLTQERSHTRRAFMVVRW